MVISLVLTEGYNGTLRGPGPEIKHKTKKRWEAARDPLLKDWRNTSHPTPSDQRPSVLPSISFGEWER